MSISQLAELAGEAGFSHITEFNSEILRFLPEVREMCAADKCHCYGKCWSCPPAYLSLESIETRVSSYGGGILLQTTAELEDDFDMEAMTRAEKTHKENFIQLVRQARLIDPDCFPMGVGPCPICRKCTCPDRPCRFPRKMITSMEACGLLVSEVCTAAGAKYNYGPRTMTYTSLILTGRK